MAHPGTNVLRKIIGIQILPDRHSNSLSISLNSQPIKKKNITNINIVNNKPYCFIQEKYKQYIG